MRHREVEEIMAAHRRTVEEFLAAARAIPDERWWTPLADRDWSPAQVVEHVALAYEVVGGEAEGKQGMKVRTKWWQRVLLRLKFLPGILEGKGIPGRPPAPRELRPSERPAAKEPLLARLDDAARRTSDAMVVAAGRSGKLTHAYFGRLTAKEMAVFGMEHTRHHMKQLTGEKQ